MAGSISTFGAGVEMSRNAEVADKLERIGQLFQIKNDRWRATSYLSAARLMRSCTDIETTDPKSLTGIGDSIAKCIDQILRTGTSDKLQALEKEPNAMALGLTVIPGIGPKTAMKIAKEFGIDTVEKLEAALRNGTIENQSWLDAIEFAKKKTSARLDRSLVEPLVAEIVGALSKVPGALKVEPAGSFRRKLSTVKDVDILVATSNGAEPYEAVFSGFGQVINKGEHKCSIRANAVPVQVDLLVVEPSNWGSAMCYFTGSKEHNVRLRAEAKALGLLVNEYGIFRVSISGDDRIGGEHENDLYRILNIPYVLPEDRIS